MKQGTKKIAGKRFRERRFKRSQRIEIQPEIFTKFYFSALFTISCYILNLDLQLKLFSLHNNNLSHYNLLHMFLKSSKMKETFTFKTHKILAVHFVLHFGK